MRKLAKLPILTGVVAIAVLVTMSPAFGAAQTTAQQILGSGSDTTYNMMVALGTVYNNSAGCEVIASPQVKDFSCTGTPLISANENYFHDVVSEAYPIGSGGGVGQLCSKGLAGTANIDFARSSRVPISTDCTGLHFVAYARDGVSWECFPTFKLAGCGGATGVTNLTTSQLKAIFVTCTTTTWSQVGGRAATPITVYVPQGNSGTGVTWAAFLGVNLAAGAVLSNCLSPGSNGSPGAPGSHVSFENTNQYIIANGDQKTAIFPYSIGVYTQTYGSSNGTKIDKSELMSINGVTPTPANVTNQTFPVLRDLFNVYCAGDPTNKNLCGTAKKSPAWVTNFVGEQGWICKGESSHNDLNGKPDTDPITGAAYRTKSAVGKSPNGEIPDIIRSQGFVPIEKQHDGTYCLSFSG